MRLPIYFHIYIWLRRLNLVWQQNIVHSAAHRQLTTLGLINLAFSLLASRQKTSRAIYSFGELILVRLAKSQPETAPHILGQLADRLAGDVTAQGQYASECITSKEVILRISWILNSQRHVIAYNRALYTSVWLPILGNNQYLEADCFIFPLPRWRTLTQPIETLRRTLPGNLQIYWFQKNSLLKFNQNVLTVLPT